ncbi:MAG: tetratricopeptide repeat protein [bacterium]|nr:tetratricopeptide repeat protein [bacterium]
MENHTTIATFHRIIGIIGREKTILLGIFLLAFLLRLGYLWQISSAPYFDDPIGDSQIYYQRALEILAGDLLGKDVFFHSSPPYPYFIAAALAVSGHSLFFVYLLQILIGSGNCILIYLLTKRLANGRIYPAILAGLFAGFYGLFAFFDGDMLMIFLTVFCVDLSILLLLKYLETKQIRYSFFAGLSFGLAVLDKPNLLLFVPVAMVFLVRDWSDRAIRCRRWHWKPAFLYLGAIFLLMMPVTIRNYIVGHDFVLISSNGGVNFYIGNNPNSLGTFKLPKGSGLRDPGLYESSVAVAEQALGRQLKPSEVSNYWARKAGEFMLNHPCQALKLFARKLLLLLNAYEVPNHQNYYYIRTEFAPLLNFMPVGFWFIAPLAFAGIVWQMKSGCNLVGKLYGSFLVCYTVSLLLFFVTERYRLPMVPFLIAFAAMAIDAIRRTVPSWRAYIFWGITLLISGIVVFLPVQRFRYSFDRIAVGTKYFNHARRIQGTQGYMYLQMAIVNYKWALETDPTLAYGHYDLGLAYEVIGYNSGAIREYETTLQLDPGFTAATLAILSVKEKYAKIGDTIESTAIPRTPYEDILALESTAPPAMNIQRYRELTARDPFHYEAFNRLGQLYFQQKQYTQAIRAYKKGLAVQPNHGMLLNNLAETYAKLGKFALANRLWQRCLSLDPNNQTIRQRIHQ